ncbi:tail sheath stabilizer and completion protein [Vibrio phage nt-1]|uniref:Tail sheath stabilizer and completion protein n=1 Tax=Vibrio phage nt-1 TaxID=115992 RepID=R9TI70_9CAUD|nr:tail sheath [Vibrio phage nt-1]AGN30025.2 tail sheath stabilizer and completion protein [Vibrio phage nt-1]
MGNLFSNIYVSRGDSYRKVPITVSSKEHFIASLNSQELNGNGSVANVATLLPRIGLDMVSCTYDATRKTNIANRKLTRDFSGDRPKSNKLFNPVPYDFEFEVSIYTRHQDDAFQIIEQILPYFQPQFNTMIKELDENEVIVDQRDIPIILESAVPETTFEGSAGDMRHIEWTLNLRMKGWLYPPTNAQFGEIRTIYLDFNEEEQVIIKAERDTVESSLESAWGVRASVDGVLESIWRYGVDSLLEAPWDVREIIESNYVSTWDSRVSIEDSLDIDYYSHVMVDTSLDIDYESRNGVEIDYSLDFVMTEYAISELQTDWVSTSYVDTSLDTNWETRASAELDLITSWESRNEVEYDYSSSWDIKDQVDSSIEVTFNIEN